MPCSWTARDIEKERTKRGLDDKILDEALKTGMNPAADAFAVLDDLLFMSLVKVRALKRRSALRDQEVLQILFQNRDTFETRFIFKEDF